MAYKPLSAKFAQVRFNGAANSVGSGTVVTAKKWTVTPTADKLDVTNFEGSGYAEWLPGIYQCDFTVEGDWDSQGNEFGAPPNFTIGQQLTNVYLYTAGINYAPTIGYWFFPFANIFETPMTAAVRETVTFAINCTAQGSFVYPGQTIAQSAVSPIAFVTP